MGTSSKYGSSFGNRSRSRMSWKEVPGESWYVSVSASLKVGDERPLRGCLRERRHCSGIGIGEGVEGGYEPVLGYGNEVVLWRPISGDIGRGEADNAKDDTLRGGEGKGSC
jgi:hypothetical protein